MPKQKISKLQMCSLVLLTICGFIVPMFSYEHFSGCSFLFHFLLAQIPVFLMLWLFKSVLAGEPGDYYEGFVEKAVLIIVALFMLVVFAVVFYITVDFWSVYNYRSHVHIVYALLISLIVYGCSAFGEEVMARLSLWLILLPSIVLLLNFIFLVPQMEPQRLLPVEISFDKQGIMQILFLSAMYIPPVLFIYVYKRSVKQQLKGKELFWLFGIGGILLIIAILRSVLVLGKATELYIYPLGQTLKMISFPGAIGGIELFGLLAIMIVSIAYMIAANGVISYILQRLIPKVKFKWLCLIPLWINLLAFIAIYKLPTKVLQPYFRYSVILGAGVCFIILLIKKFTVKKKVKSSKC